MSTRIYALLSALILSGYGQSVSAGNMADVCKTVIAEVGQSTGGAIDHQLNAVFERHSLSDLIKPGDENLAKRYPWLVMSSAQRALDMISSEGVKEVTDSRNGFGRVKRYAFFSDAVDLTGNKHIVGQLPAIEALVSFIHSKALGNPTAQNVPTLVGPPGTGKSYILSLFQEALRRGTLGRERFYTYTFEWVNLHEIPALKTSLPKDVTDPESPRALPEPLNDSPFALLPSPIQDYVIAQARDNVLARIGMEPKPKRQISAAKTRHIRDTILQQKSLELGRGLTLQETLETLDHHIKIKRLILGDEATSPVLPYQGREPNIPMLFGGPNAFYKTMLGSDHPMSTDYGQVARANGGIIFWDELLKNETALTSVLLNFFSSGVVNIGGSAPTQVDILNLAATNTRDIPKIRERDPDSPLLDRNNQIPWNLLVYPEEVGRVLLMEIPNLKMKALGSVNGGDYLPAQGQALFKLFPEREPLRPITTPHGRYALKIRNGSKEYHISPHSLEFMAYVISLSRMNFLPERVEFANSFPMVKVKDRIFMDPPTRLRVLLGEQQVEDSQLAELSRISVAGGEGTFGISHRDVEKWWERTLQEAEKSNNHGTITPFLLAETLDKVISENTILQDKTETKMYASLYSRIVFHNFVRPGMREDLDLALGRSEGRDVIDQMYDEIIQEIRQLQVNRSATRYTRMPQNEQKLIQFERLEAIQKYYVQKNGRELSFPEIAAWNLSFSPVRDDQAVQTRHPALINAIATYHSNVVLKKEQMTLQRLLDVASESVTDAKANEQTRASELLTVLENDLGYNLHSARVALEMVSSQEANRSAAQ